MPIKVTLANAVEAWEEQHTRKLTPTVMARALNVDESELCQLWHGEANSISFDLLDRLCVALDCTPDDLLLHTADPEQQEQFADRLGGNLGKSMAA